MIMDVLERSFETDVFHERDPRAFDNYHLKDTETIRALIDRSRARLVVVKCLLESQRISDLLDAFAPAKAFWALRDYRDVVNSMLVSFKNQAAQVKRIATDRNSDGWIGESMSDATHALLREIVDDSLDNATASALQWYFRNIRFFEQGLDRDSRVLLVRYEPLVTDASAEFARLFSFAGLRFTPRLASRVSTRSIGRRPAPKIAPEVEALCRTLFERFSALGIEGVRAGAVR